MTEHDQTPPAVAPLVLQLAPLPREQLGPFFILGVDKVADQEAIEAGWAQHLIWARKNQIATPLEDINWARDFLNTPDKRARADASALNLDLSTGWLGRLRARYQNSQSPGQLLLDVEHSLADYTPPIPLPSPDDIRRSLPAGEVPLEIPAVARILEEFARPPLDPWNLDLSP